MDEKQSQWGFSSLLEILSSNADHAWTINKERTDKKPDRWNTIKRNLEEIWRRTLSMGQRDVFDEKVKITQAKWPKKGKVVKSWWKEKAFEGEEVIDNEATQKQAR